MLIQGKSERGFFVRIFHRSLRVSPLPPPFRFNILFTRHKGGYDVTAGVTTACAVSTPFIGAAANGPVGDAGSLNGAIDLDIDPAFVLPPFRWGFASCWAETIPPIPYSLYRGRFLDP
jgi:hypothetical protein